MDKAKKDAEYIQQTTKQAQKLLYAAWDSVEMAVLRKK